MANETRQPNNGGPGGAARGDASSGRGMSGHLTDEVLRAYLDGDLDPGDRVGAAAHLATCPHCRRDLADIRATVSLLRGLPQARPRRSFQLGPDHARDRQPRWQRWFARLIPALPALRAATAGVALLLLAVTAGDLLTNRPTTESNRTTGSAVQPTRLPNVQAAAPPTAALLAPEAAGGRGGNTAPNVQQPAPDQTGAVPPAPTGASLPPPAPTATRVVGLGAAAGSGDAVANQATEDGNRTPAQAASGADSTNGSDVGGSRGAAITAVEPSVPQPAPKSALPSRATGETGKAAATVGASTGSFAIATPAPATATPTFPATTTATPASPAASPTAPLAPTASPISPRPTAATPPAAPGAGQTTGRSSGWRLAEIGLAALLAWLVVSVIGLQRVRRRQ